MLKGKIIKTRAIYGILLYEAHLFVIENQGIHLQRVKADRWLNIDFGRHKMVSKEKNLTLNTAFSEMYSEGCVFFR